VLDAIIAMREVLHRTKIAREKKLPAKRYFQIALIEFPCIFIVIAWHIIACIAMIICVVFMLFLIIIPCCLWEIIPETAFGEWSTCVYKQKGEANGK